MMIRDPRKPPLSTLKNPFLAAVLLLLGFLLVSHVLCKRGYRDACILVYSLPTDVLRCVRSQQAAPSLISSLDSPSDISTGQNKGEGTIIDDEGYLVAQEELPMVREIKDGQGTTLNTIKGQLKSSQSSSTTVAAATAHPSSPPSPPSHQRGQGSHPLSILPVGKQANTTEPRRPECSDVQLNRPYGQFVLRQLPPYGYRCKYIHSNYACEKYPPASLQWQPAVAVDQCYYPDHSPVSAARARVVRHNSRPTKPFPVKVVIVGDSFLRQVVEAIACRWESEMTSRKVLQYSYLPPHGPPRRGYLVEHRGICHNPDPFFMAEPLLYPPQPQCSDDAAYLRFGDELEIFWLWRAWSINHVMSWFGIDMFSVDVIVSQPRIWTGGGLHPPFKLKRLRDWGYQGQVIYITRTDARPSITHCLTISVIRLRDDTRADGGHVCLPGVPDDAARLMFGMIANPTVFGAGCSLPNADYQTDGNDYHPVSSRGRIFPDVNQNTAWTAAMGYKFFISPADGANLKTTWKGEGTPKNKILHDVDDYLEASYGRNLTTSPLPSLNINTTTTSTPTAGPGFNESAVIDVLQRQVEQDNEIARSRGFWIQSLTPGEVGIDVAFASKSHGSKKSKNKPGGSTKPGSRKKK